MECWAADGQAECLAEQMMVEIYGLESRGITVGWYISLLYYDHLYSITKTIQRLFILLFSH